MITSDVHILKTMKWMKDLHVVVKKTRQQPIPRVNNWWTDWQNRTLSVARKAAVCVTSDIYPSLYPVEGFPPMADSWLPLLHLEEFPNNHDHSQPFILKYQRCLIDFRTIYNMWSLLWSENKWDLGNVQRFIGSLRWADRFTIHYRWFFLYSCTRFTDIHTYSNQSWGDLLLSHSLPLSPVDIQMWTFNAGTNPSTATITN